MVIPKEKLPHRIVGLKHRIDGISTITALATYAIDRLKAYVEFREKIDRMAKRSLNP